jgi:peroxiredoxin
MALTPSTMLELGTPAPDFSLNTADGQPFALADQHIDKGLLVIFSCNHCPYVKHIRKKLVEKIREYQAKGITVVAINSNDYEVHPDDSPEKMLEEARIHQFTFPYLVDTDQRVAQAYRAACTPDLFLFDGNRRLVYRGQFDAARPGNDIEVTGADLSAAVDGLVSGGKISVEQKPSMGCNIKWKPGNEPHYFAKP